MYIHKLCSHGTLLRRSVITKNTASRLTRLQRFLPTQKRLNWEDAGHSQHEDRRKRLGLCIAGRVLLVVYTSRRMKNAIETVRIISARQASRKEREAYSGQKD